MAVFHFHVLAKRVDERMNLLIRYTSFKNCAMDSDNVMTAVHEYTITNEIRIFILDITFNKLKCLQNSVKPISYS